VRRGDIILYGWEQGVIAHRIAGAEKTADGRLRLMMRGDAVGAQVEPVRPEQILGKVVALERDGRRINPYGMLSQVRRLIHPLASHLMQWMLLQRM
jgi:hypothetical protein